jgi:hypothetical protein
VEFDDAARNDSVIGKKEFVIAVDGVEKVSVNSLPVAHGKMLVDAHGERSPGGKSASFGLA